MVIISITYQDGSIGRWQFDPDNADDQRVIIQLDDLLGSPDIQL